MKNRQSLENKWTAVSRIPADRHQPQEPEKSSSASFDTWYETQCDERERAGNDPIALPSHVAGSGTLDRLIDTARDYAEASTAGNTNKAYAADWKHFTRWCRLKGTEPLPPSPEMVGLYVADLAAPAGKAPALSVSTIEHGSGWAPQKRDRASKFERQNVQKKREA